MERFEIAIGDILFWVANSRGFSKNDNWGNNGNKGGWRKIVTDVITFIHVTFTVVTHVTTLTRFYCMHQQLVCVTQSVLMRKLIEMNYAFVNHHKTEWFCRHSSNCIDIKCWQLAIYKGKTLQVRMLQSLIIIVHFTNAVNKPLM